MNPRRGLALMLLACLLFSGMSLCVALAHRAQPDLSTAVASLWRSAVNLLLLLPMAGFRWRALVGDGRPALWARGVCGAAALLTYFAAIPRVGMGESAFLNQTSAVWVALLAPPLLGERTGRLVWLAVVVGLGGLALMSAPRPGLDAAGLGIGAASGLFAALAYLAMRRGGATNTAVTLVFWFTAMSTVASAALAVGGVGPRSWAVVGLLVGAGVFATRAQLLMTRAYQEAPAALVASAGVLSPVLSGLWGWLVLGEQPTGRALAGMALVLVATVGLPWLASRAPKVNPV